MFITELKSGELAGTDVSSSMAAAGKPKMRGQQEPRLVGALVLVLEEKDADDLAPKWIDDVIDRFKQKIVSA